MMHHHDVAHAGAVLETLLTGFQQKPIWGVVHFLFYLNMNKITLINRFTVKSYHSQSIQKDLMHYKRVAEVTNA